ncbi:MAG: HAD-IA family hydrolase [Thermodesulfobacteriota bacterium]|nr:HAD-IA family hydrolase [Thermodesulfobacteriota bacterium]
MILGKPKFEAKVDWQMIDTILLDMDGTLLDKHFDDYFWEEYVPEVFAEKNKISVFDAEEELLARYRKKEGSLDWTDLDFWSKELGLDIVALKKKMNYLIKVHPYVVEFLEHYRENNKKIYLVTNAHSKTLAIKMKKTGLANHFDRIICSEEVGMAKEDPEFWKKLEGMLNFSKDKTILADDNEKVLDAAQEFGFSRDQLIFVAKSSSTMPVIHSKNFPSIIFFKELMV